jgi:hypothetical protein
MQMTRSFGRRNTLTKECPGIAAGHFESADTVSYAALLVPAAKQPTGFQIIAFSKGPEADAYSMKVLEHTKGKDQFAPVIYKVPPANTWASTIRSQFGWGWTASMWNGSKRALISITGGEAVTTRFGHRTRGGHAGRVVFSDVCTHRWTTCRERTSDQQKGCAAYR